MIRFLLIKERWTTFVIVICFFVMLFTLLAGCTAEQKEIIMNIGRQAGESAARMAIEKYRADHPDAIPEEAAGAVDLLPALIGLIPGLILGGIEMAKRKRTEDAIRTYSDTFDLGETSESGISSAFNGVRAFMKGARLAASSNPSRTVKRNLARFDRIRKG